MNIVYLIDQPNLYGSEKHLLGLVRHFSKLNNVSLVSFAKKGKLLDILNNEDLNVRSFKIDWLPNKDLKLFAEMIKNSNDVIFHGHQPKAIFWGSIFAWYYKKIFISTIHSLPDTNARSSNTMLMKGIVFLFHFLVKNITELLSTRIIYLSKFSFEKSLFKNKSLIIPNWIDFIPNMSLLNHSFDPNCIKLISVGSITYNKGFDRLLLALSTLEHKNWKLTVVGDGSGEYISELKSICEKKNIDKNIVFLSFDNQIYEKLGAFDAFILLSRGETFGLVYIEAMSWGLPIFAWDIPVIKEIIPKGNVIVKNLDEFSFHFNDFFNSQVEYKKQSIANRDFVLKKFKKDIIMEKYEVLYNKINHR